VPAVAPLAATITGYSVGLFIHVLAVVLAFGPTFAFGFFVAAAEGSSPRSVPFVLRTITNVNRFMVTPGMIVLLLAGIYLVSDADISLSETYVSVGFVAIIALFGLVHGYFIPRGRKAEELAERDLGSGDELSAEYHALSKQIATVGQITGLIVAITIFFMVVKP
jgi:uncharacterized membrane protein